MEMMDILLTPVCMDASPPTVIKQGDILTIDGDGFDFTSLPDGSSLPPGLVPSRWIDPNRPVERVNGKLRITLILPHNRAPEPFQSFPAAIENAADGPIDLPQNTRVETREEPVRGGVLVITTRYVWGRTPEPETVFIAIAEEAKEADDAVDA
jgi:hypothetical protein